MEDGLYQIVRSRRYFLPTSGTLEGGAIGIYNEAGSPAYSSRFTSQWFKSANGTEYFEYGFTAFPSKYSSITKIRVHCDYYAINDYIWSIALSDWDGTDHNHTQCTITPFIKVNGVRYFGTPADYGADNPAGHASDPPADEFLLTKKTIYYDWSWNPETVATWTVSDMKNITFGVRTQATGGAMGCLIIWNLYPKFYYEGEYSLSDDFEYKLISPIDETLSLTQYTQTPIRADDLTFRLTHHLPERSEIALVKDHLLIFRGVVWTAKELSPFTTEVLAKSQQILLDYRLIGSDFIPPTIPSAFTIDDLFLDTAPEYPSYGYIVESTRAEVETDVFVTKYYWIVTYGLFNFLNSWNGTFRNFILPGSSASLEDHEYDTFLRPGTNDMDDWEFTTYPEVNGVAAKVFSDLFAKFGQEVRYRYWWDGLVYQDAATEIANGSEAMPLYEFSDGIDGQISKRIPTLPVPTAAYGSNYNPKVSCDWSRHRSYFSNIYNSQRIADDLQEYLDAQIQVDDSLYDVALQGEYWHIRPGDYIAVQPKNYPLTPVRVRQITTGKGKTQILAGTRLLSLNEQFGIWRDAKYSGHTYTTLKTLEIAEETDLSLSSSLTIYSGDLANPGWQCVVSISWGFFMDNLVYDGEGDDWAPIYSYSSPFPTEAYVQVYGESYSAYGPHEYEFYITRNITAHGIEPYGENDVEVITTGKFKWRKDGGAWSEEIEGYDVWHETSEFNADLGDGLAGRVIFSLVPPADPWMVPKTSDILGRSASAYACDTIDLSLTEKVLIIKIDGKAVPPGRYLAKGDSGSLEVDITEFVNSAATYTLTAELVGGQAKGDYPNYYHTLSGEITQYSKEIPLEPA